MSKKQNIAQIVLNELDQFDNYRPREFNATKTVSLTGSPRKDRIYESTQTVNANEILSSKEPFIAYVKVKEKEDNSNWQERIYLVCRNYQPMAINPVTSGAMFVSRNAPVGVVASAEVGEEGCIDFALRNKRVKKHFEVIEKNVFTPRKDAQWDAINNQLSYLSGKEFIPSLRSKFSFLTQKLKQIEADVQPIEDYTEGQNLAKEIAEATLKSIKTEDEKKLAKQIRKKAVNESISLKDQPILDTNQDDFCRLYLASQILLVGSPGTGKTTTLIKRIAYKIDPYHLQQTDEIELAPEQLASWMMFTPNDLLKMYLKEAMVKEGLHATEDKVATWEVERTNLGRNILKILKTPKSGIFNKMKSEILVNSSSKNLIEYTNTFIRFFNNTIHQDFSETVAFVEKHKPFSAIISKANYKLSEKFEVFAKECKRIDQANKTRKFSDLEVKTIYLIDEFQKLKPLLTEIRTGVKEIIDNLLNDLIIKHPEIIKQISSLVAESRVLNERPSNTDPNNKILPTSETDEAEEAVDEGDEIDEIDEEETGGEDANDLRLEAVRLIRQTLRRHAESIAIKQPLKNKRLIIVWNLISPFFNDENLLNFIGRINISTRRKVFSQLDFGRILEQIPVTYDKFRQELVKSKARQVFVADAAESIKNKRISHNETDVLIYTTLRFAAKIFKEKRDFLRTTQNFDILENIKSQYRTQIAVDEAADFSAVQLGSMYHLAHPQYKSVSFAGDLMQRVTNCGLKDWNECDFISPDFKTKELLISYRQTPVLLGIASKLYEHVIGQEAPFYSKNEISDQDPRPLKFKAKDDDSLGDWIAERIHEIYEINKPKFPSVAIFVPEESDIDIVHDIIAEKLDNMSIDVEKCKEGKVLGTGSKVRIFSVEYIKGLEFEGVFFVGIDDIHQRKPDLLDKYLYVGLTRATTFLGVTYKTHFPAKIQFIESDFSDGNWDEFI